MNRSFLPPRMPDSPEIASLKSMLDARDHALLEARARIAELEAEHTRQTEALDRIRLEDLSAFDCKLVAAKAQGLIP